MRHQLNKNVLPVRKAWASPSRPTSRMSAQMLIGFVIITSWAFIVPNDLFAQASCLNIAGRWNVAETATLACTVTVAGESETYSDPLDASRSITIFQDPGSCSFRYDPGTIGAGIVQYVRTEVRGEIVGSSVTASGGHLLPAPGVQLVRTSFEASGQTSQTSMTLTGSGLFEINQPLEGGLTGNLSCEFRSTAQFSRPAPTAPPETTPPQIRATQPVLQAFLGGERLSSGTWVEIFGEDFSTETRDWSGLIQDNRAPTSINGVRVNIDAKPAYLFFVSPNQINAQVPDGVGLGPVTVEVVTAAGRSSATVQATAISPALLTTPAFNVGGRQYVAALFGSELNQGQVVFVGRPDLIPGASFRPARPGDVLTIFAIGCGPASPPAPAGQIVQGASELSNPVEVFFGGMPAQSSGFLSSGAIGLC